MTPCQKQIKRSSYVSCIFMMLALAWLTVSLPFVYASRQAAKSTFSVNKNTTADNNEKEDTSNPFANTTEEKTSGSVNTLSEEYLHDAHSSDEDFSVPSTEYKVEHASTYIAFHGELISPPPDLS